MRRWNVETGKLTQHGDASATYSDFFASLAYCSGGQIFVLWLLLSAGETDLAAVPP